MATQAMTADSAITEKTYKKRVWAWTMYDWANSAFVTTVGAAVLPIYYSQVAGATLASPAVATSYWSIGLSISLLIAAVISPILGTVSDIMRGKKMFLAIFAGIGILGTALLVFVSTGDWMLASLLAIIGRVGFNGANVFYDALLPHVARSDDQDRVSTRGYAMGYLGGGILLAVNVVMIMFLPGTWGPRLSFLSVAIWWLVFSIPIFRHVPEPPAATVMLKKGQSALSASFKRLGSTLKDISQYRELFKYLIAFLLYVDGIGTIIGVAAIYGAELGFGSVELILALLLVQFVGIPYSLIFGRLPNPKERRRSFFLAFVIFNMVALPLVGLLGAQFLPSQITGTPPPPYTSTATASGQGVYLAEDQAIVYSGAWQPVTISAATLGENADQVYQMTNEPDASYAFAFNGQSVTFEYSTGPDFGIWAVEVDGQPFIDPDTKEALTIDGYSENPRYQITKFIQLETAGEHTLTVINTGEKDPASTGTKMSLANIENLPPIRQSNLLYIIGMILAVEVVCLGLAFLLRHLFDPLAKKLDTKRSILLSLVVYSIIAIWGFFLNSVVEFWFLAWMVAVVQGGSQALSRSLFAYMSPAVKSGEFFGLFGIMEKFSGVLGPFLFALAATTFDSSRPAVLSLIVFFVVGGFLLTRVNVSEGRRVAEAEDAALIGSVSGD